MRILVVDDCSTVRKSIKEELEHSGYQVDLAATGSEALDLIDKRSCYNLITLDVNLPDYNGYTLCQIIRTLENEEKSEVPIVFISAESSIESRKRGLFLGAVDFLTKRNSRGEITQTVDRIINRDNALKGRKGLLICNEDSLKNSVSNCLKNHGIDIVFCIDVNEAIGLLTKEEGELDFLLIDQNLLEITGEKLTDKIRRELGLRDIPIILMTEADSVNAISEFYHNGGTDCLKKPFHDSELVARVTAILKNDHQTKVMEKMVSELKQANHDKDEFLAVCSHDLKSPLTSIVGFAELMQLDSSLSEGHREDIKRIHQSGTILMNLIDNILDLTRVKSHSVGLKIEELPLKEILDSSYSSNIGFATRKGVSLNVDQNSMNNRVVYGNRLALLRCFNNLLSNAIKFTPKGGKVDVVCDFRGHEAIVYVKDNGVGISESNINDLFNISSMDSINGTEGERGTGLGLVIVKEILEQHNGTIEVKSEEGKGTHFKCNLPLKHTD